MAITRSQLHQPDRFDAHKNIAITQVIAVTQIAITKVYYIRSAPSLAGST